MTFTYVLPSFWMQNCSAIFAVGLCRNDSYVLVHTRFISDVCQLGNWMQCRKDGDKIWVVKVLKPGSCSPFLCACSIHDRKI